MFVCPLSEEHVIVLLDIRGDVSRDIRGAVLDLLEQSAPPLPAGYRPIFTDILVPPSTMAFCLPTAKCAWQEIKQQPELRFSYWKKIKEGPVFDTMALSFIQGSAS